MSSSPIDLAAALWEKSSYSGSNEGECVEFTRTFAACGVIPVRDSKDPAGPALLFTTEAWSTFVGGLKSRRLADS